MGKREKPFEGRFFPASPNPITLFPLSAVALAKEENLLLALIFLRCKKINALKFEKLFIIFEEQLDNEFFISFTANFLHSLTAL